MSEMGMREDGDEREQLSVLILMRCEIPLNFPSDKKIAFHPKKNKQTR